MTLNLGATKVSFQTQADAPSCADCGSIMVRNGSCYKCLNCGSNERMQLITRANQKRSPVDDRASYLSGVTSRRTAPSRLGCRDEKGGPTMRVFVAGANGAVGRRLVPMLVARGHQVTGTTTSESSVEALRKLGR